MSRPAPLVSKRPRESTAVVGGTSLGTPLKTRTVVGSATAGSAVGSSAAAASAGHVTPQRARPAPAGSPAAAARTPAKTPVRGFGSSLPSTNGAAGAPPAPPSSSPAAAASSSSSSGPASSPKVISRQRYDSNKAADVFSSGKQKFKTPFSEAYTNGSIPCRINHGSVKFYLQWDRPSHELDLRTLLPLVAEGVRETEHPFVVLARQAFAELCAEGGQARVAPVLPQVVQALRRALIDPTPGVFVAACQALQQLSACVGPLLNAHLDALLQQVHKKALHKGFGDIVGDTIGKLATNGGDEAVPLIKKRVPGFVM